MSNSSTTWANENQFRTQPDFRIAAFERLDAREREWRQQRCSRIIFRRGSSTALESQRKSYVELEWNGGRCHKALQSRRGGIERRLPSGRGSGEREHYPAQPAVRGGEFFLNERSRSNMKVELGQIRAARASLQKFRLKLLRPSVAALESGSADLMFAVGCLERLEPVLKSRGTLPLAIERALRLEVAGLRRDLEQVKALLEGAGRFYQGWSRLLGCATGAEAANYTADGQPGASVSNDMRKAVMIHG